MAAKTFDFDVTFEELLWMQGAGGMNEVLDERMEQAGLQATATDISYEAHKMDNKTGMITVRATYTPDSDFDEDSEDNYVVGS